nr:selenium cofactor biosynthesis protein YqeC [uncultured Sellimonas sp.]
MPGTGRMGENMLGELGLKDASCVAFTGAGGKTTAVYTCVRECRKADVMAAAVTTTKMWKPEEGFLVWKGDCSFQEVKEKIREYGKMPLTIGRELPKGKIGPIPETAMRALMERGIRLYVEADGARGRWVKVPGSREPEVPDFCDAVIGILNWKAVGKTFWEAAHRPESCAASLGKAPEDSVEMEDLCRLWLKEDGIFQNCGPVPVKKAVLSGVEAGMGMTVFQKYRKLFQEMRHRGMPVYIWENGNDRQRVFMPDQEPL